MGAASLAMRAASFPASETVLGSAAVAAAAGATAKSAAAAAGDWTTVLLGGPLVSATFVPSGTMAPGATRGAGGMLPPPEDLLLGGCALVLDLSSLLMSIWTELLRL